MNLKDCYEKGLLKKEKISKEKALKSIEIAKKYLKKANDNYEIENYDVAIVLCYTSMFHSARAILFKDGIKERSHACIVIYLKEKYKNLKQFADILDSYRIFRHTLLYGLDSRVGKIQAETSMKSAKEFNSEIENLMGGA